MEAERAPRGRPRAEPSAVQRARLLAAARQLFTEQGYDATTVAEVTRRAGVSRAVAYELVGDKPALLAAVADQVADEISDAFLAQVDVAAGLDVSVPELVRTTVAWYVRTLGGDPSLGAIVALSGLLPPDESSAVVRARRAFEDRLTQLHVDRSGGNGAREASARLLAVGVAALVESVAERVVVDGWPVEEAAALVAEALVGLYGQVRDSPEGVAASVRFNRAMADRPAPPT